LPFGYEIGKIVKYAGLNSDQLDLIFGKNLARLLRIEPKPSDPKTTDITRIWRREISQNSYLALPMAPARSGR
jgi:hypothetical protein